MVRISIGIVSLMLLLSVNSNAQVGVDFQDVVSETSAATFTLTWNTPKNKSPQWRQRITPPANRVLPPVGAAPVPPMPPVPPNGLPQAAAIGPLATYQTFAFSGFPIPQPASRVGFAVAPDLIVSIDVPQDKIQLKSSDGEMLDGEVLIRDHVTGLAAIRVEGAEFVPIEVADEVSAAGSPVVLNWMPGGVVASQSAMIATVPYADEHQWGFVQLLDVPVDMNKQGAPVINAVGQLAGVLVNKPTSAFCLSPHQVRLLIDAAQADEPEDLIRGRLGLQLGTDNSTVHAVMPDTPASDANIMSGDVIVKVDDAPCKTHLDVLAALSMFRAGDKVDLALEREGEQVDVQLKLSKLTFGIASTNHNNGLPKPVPQMFQLKDGQLVPMDESGGAVLERLPKIVVGGLRVERSRLEDSLKSLEMEKQRQDELIEELRKKIAQMEEEAFEKIQKAKEADERKLDAIVEEIRERLHGDAKDN